MVILLNLTTNSFKLKKKKTGQTGSTDSKDGEIMVLLKYLSNARRTLEMPSINCEINLILICSSNCVIKSVDQATTFTIADVPVATLSTKDNASTIKIWF